MLCEEGMTIVETNNALSIPQNNAGKIDKHCTNYAMINHNLET
jgi:hypothetical protein